MAPRTQTFDPKQAPPTYNNRVITGASQNVIRVTFDTDVSVDEIGADQEGVDIIQNDYRAIIEIFLMQTSRSNQLFSNVLNIRRAGTGLSKFPFLWQDPLSSDLVSAPLCWPLSYPPLTRGKAGAEMVWRLRTFNCIVNYGGSDQPG